VTGTRADRFTQAASQIPRHSQPSRPVLRRT
jgi:hypothetical protein